MEGMRFRKAEARDLVAVGTILRKAVERMLAEGKRQWNASYPNESHVIEDIKNGVGYVLEADGKVLGYAAVIFDGEPAYNSIEGAWVSEGEYVVVHRMAIDSESQRKGLGVEFIRSVEKLALSKNIRSFRIDTNFDNERMLNLLAKTGFSYCGEIRYDKGSRKAFEKLILEE